MDAGTKSSGIDADTKRSLGGALMGALILVVGLVLRASGADVMVAIGAALTVGGGLVAVICLAQVALRLIRS